MLATPPEDPMFNELAPHLAPTLREWEPYVSEWVEKEIGQELRYRIHV